MSPWGWISLAVGIAAVGGLCLSLRERRADRIAREARQQEADPDSWWV